MDGSHGREAKSVVDIMDTAATQRAGSSQHDFDLGEHGSWSFFASSDTIGQVLQMQRYAM